MLSFLRQHARMPRTSNATQNPLVLDGGRASLKFIRSTSNPYFMTATLPPRLRSELPTAKQPNVYPNQRSCPIVPPPHWHSAQDETFRVVSGKMVATVSGRQSVLGEGEDVLIPRGFVHTFANASAEHDLVVDVKLDPDNRARDERFFRNGYGYLDDCARAGVTPPIPQAMLMLYSADIIPAMPGPRVIMRVIETWVAWFGAVVIGKWVLGYSEWYEEYTPLELRELKEA